LPKKGVLFLPWVTTVERSKALELTKPVVAYYLGSAAGRREVRGLGLATADPSDRAGKYPHFRSQRGKTKRNLNFPILKVCPYQG